MPRTGMIAGCLMWAALASTLYNTEPLFGQCCNVAEDCPWPYGCQFDGTYCTQDGVLYPGHCIFSFAPSLEGSKVPPIEVKTPDGQLLRVEHSAGGLPTILYVFSQECSWSARNINGINALAMQIRASYRLIAVSLSVNSLHSDLAKSDLNFRVYGEVEKASAFAYELDSAPQTLVISTDGRVLRQWRGAYQGHLKTEIEEYFKVHLPSLN
jgi:hypothetical protein